MNESTEKKPVKKQYYIYEVKLQFRPKTGLGKKTFKAHVYWHKKSEVEKIAEQYCVDFIAKHAPNFTYTITSVKRLDVLFLATSPIRPIQ